MRNEPFNYISVLKYCFTLAVFITFNLMEETVYPYSTAMLSALIALGSSPIITSLIYLLSFIVCGAPTLLGSAIVPALLLPLIRFIYDKVGAKPSYENLLFTAVSMLGFIFIGDTNYYIPIERRVFVSLFTVILCFLCTVGVRALSEKGLKFKLGFDECLSVGVIVCVCGLGLANLTTPLVLKGVSIFFMLLAVYLFKNRTGFFLSAIFGLTYSIHFRDLNFLSVFLTFYLFMETFVNLSRYLSAFSVIGVDYLLHMIFGIYGDYGILDFLPVLIGAVAFCIIPQKPLTTLKEKLFYFREKQLVRQTINRNRLMLSNKLYELSGVFSEMANAFTLFRKNDLTEDKVRKGIEREVLNTVCKRCENYDKCKRSIKNLSSSIGKITDIGFAKGKLSFIDLSKDILSTCIHPNDVLFSINRLLADYRNYKLENANVVSGREMIAREAVGVSEILRGLALESGTLLKYQSRTERQLSEALFKSGFAVSEILIYGENHLTSISMIITMREFSVKTLQNVISKTLGVEYMLSDKADLGEDKCFLVFRQTADYDAVFGFSKATKDNSEVSGDTYSVVRLNGNKFLVALSDGMGSGEQAEAVSSASLSLIESFYKAGLSSDLILSTVNKLLAINTEDSYTALDVSVIDLKYCTADFIKYGSPYGFIISDGGIRIIEGNSLPLGIIDELKPSVCSTELNDGDMILLLTDGISDAFGSSGEIIDYLRSVSAKNPQTLADGILKKAIELSLGEKKDDMTALAVRVYKRKVNLPA